MSTHAKNNAAIKRIRRSFDKYDLTLRRFTCKYDPKREAYVYVISAARRNSGTRGGRARNGRAWFLCNLFPAQREIIDTLPRQK